MEWFHEYTYGRNVTTHSDHRPLEFFETPARWSHCATIKYKVVVNDEVADESYQNYTIHTTEQKVLLIEKKRELYVEATKNDQIFRIVVKYIVNGWPDQSSLHSAKLKKYFAIRHLLTSDIEFLIAFRCNKNEAVCWTHSILVWYVYGYWDVRVDLRCLQKFHRNNDKETSEVVSTIRISMGVDRNIYLYWRLEGNVPGFVLQLARLSTVNEKIGNWNNLSV